MDANVKVFCRVRPPNERERGVPHSSLGGSAGFFARAAGPSSAFTKKCVSVPPSDAAQQTLFLHSKLGAARTFTFDRVFSEAATQNELFDVVGAPITQACLEGYNGTIFAYGQTGSGKTFTMQGPDDVIDSETPRLSREQVALRGLVPRVFDYLFDSVVAREQGKNVQHTFRCSFLEIYNERVYDLLDGGSANDAAGLQLRENGRKGVHVEGLIESVVTNSKKAAELMTVGAQNRRVGQTSMNRESSRSHSVFILQLQSKEMSAEGTKIRTSRFNLVDLAGSERQRSTDAAGERLKEAGSINKSLSALGNVIMGLAEQSVGKHRHVHYRDSKLTFLLKDSLGGNSKTFMVATISPAEDSAFETLSTLKFAQRAKMIQNSAVVNEDSVGSALFLQEEVQRLRRQLQQAHHEIARNIPGSNLLVQDDTAFEVSSSLESGATSTHQLGPQCDPAIDSRFRELEESFATTAEEKDRLMRSYEYMQLQNGNFQALCAELKNHVAHLKMMLRLRGITSSGAHDYKPTADAIEWRMKYEEMEERFVELQDERQRSGFEESGATGKANREVENLNMMLLALTKQLTFVLHDKHDLQDRLLENQSGKDESMDGPTSQEVVDADFSARLEEALSGYHAKLDSVAAVNACMEEKVAEASLELLQIKEREASWSIQQNDIKRELADFKMALQRSEESHSLTRKMLVQEKGKVEKLEVQLERAQEAARIEFQAALADTATANRDLQNSKKLLQHQLSSVTADLRQREHQAEKAENAIAELKVEMASIEESHQKTTLQLGEARDELTKSMLLAAHLQREISDRDNVIDGLKRSEAATIEEKLTLEQKLDESKNAIIQLRDDANTTAQRHADAIDLLNRQAQEGERRLIEDFEKQLRVKEVQMQELQVAFDNHKAKVEEADLVHATMLEEKESSLVELQRVVDDQKQESKLKIEDLQQSLSKALADLSQLSDQKDRIDSERVSAVQDIEQLQGKLKSLHNEKDAVASEMEALSEQLSVRTTDLKKQNADLEQKCDEQRAQLSGSEDTVKKFTQEVNELQQQVATQSNEIVELRKDLASAQEDERQTASELALSAAKAEELKEEIAANKDAMSELTNKLEKATSEVRDAENMASQQCEEIRMYKGIQSTLRDEVRKLEFNRLELAESLQTEQESKQDVELKFADAREAWADEKNKFTQHSQESISALEKRVEELALNRDTVLAQKHELEQENGSFKTSVAEKDRNLQELKDRAVEQEDKIRLLESSTVDSVATQDQLNNTVTELRNSLRALEQRWAEQQNTVLKQEAELSEKTTTITLLNERVQNDEATWDLKNRELKAELETTRGRAQVFEQLVAEKTAVFTKAEETFLTEKCSLEEKIMEGEEILAQHTEQLTQEINQLQSSVKEKDTQLQLAQKSLVEAEEGLARAAEENSSAKVKELQAVSEELGSKHKSLAAENSILEEKASSELKEHEEEVSRLRSELDVAEEQVKAARTELEEHKAAALATELARKEAKAKAKAQDSAGQMKRKLLTDKVKMQREIQSLTKKLETVTKENEKLVGHHNSRQKIQHHVKVKEENNRLLDQVRHLTEEKVKLQRSLEKLRSSLKEKENIGVDVTANTPPSVSPASSASSHTKKVRRPSLGSSSTATAGTAASQARAAARLAARGRPLSRSASPGPSKKRVRAHSSSSGPGWQR